MQCFSGSPPLIEILGHAEFDFVMIDTEHACIDSAQLEQLIRVANTVDLMPLVRVAENSFAPIQKALEGGAQGIIVPQVRSVADVKRALEAANYPPLGKRGMCPSTRAAEYSLAGWEEYLRWTSEEMLVIPLIEHPDAIANARDICELKGIEVVFFGPGDLGLAMGLGPRGLQYPEIEEAFDRVLEAAEATDTVVMAVPWPDLSAKACEALIGRGVRILLHSIDELLFFDTCRQIITDLRPVAKLSAPISLGRN